ncbi:hypothetical protein [Microbacterium oleivorans]|uniref:DUF4230 domain-containing protein n=1 Tax=Microbacterium oleivorans TaxID=273677 RepID=A0A177KB71_9MICO|nr:hypothetical protein [Microbacterium oleivorans]OAH50276.1 hypothetical protein AYL44_07370 [Microbacterium oleivorans]
MTATATPPTAIPPKPVRKTPIWAKILLVFVILAVIVAAALVSFNVGKIFGANESRDTQVIRSIKGEEQVILVTAGMTDVEEKREDGLNFAIGDWDLFTLPGSDRSVLVRYEYDAKFGIEGKDVEISQMGDNAYLITIPKFIYLGYANPDLSIADEENGLLSWTTPEIDTTEVFEELLSAQVVEQHIDGFRPVLMEQAKLFYSKIVQAIDPAITVEFQFTE